MGELDLSSYEHTSLWKASFGSTMAQDHATAVQELRASLSTSRANAKHLVEEIAIDLPGYTVHAIEHLDALWEIASQIAGENYVINPVEGYILGCSFLLHDAGMTLAAYPGGLTAIKETSEWRRTAQRLQSKIGSKATEDYVLETFIREQHAKQAERLPFIEWRSEEGARHLIDNGDLRHRFGDFIGLIAASHWWSHDELERRLSDKIIPAPAPFPSSWSIDLLKLACILRTADAAQIDDTRAPSFLRAIRHNRLSAYSAEHWTFQSRLTQAQNRHDTLFFASFRPFNREEARAWWLMYDTVKMVDRELRMVDSLLARKRSAEYRFAARRVANIDSPEAMSGSVPTSGWRPIDTAFSISDVPKLVARLGGTQLYGENPISAVRELIQNSIDAVRMRLLIDPAAPTPKVVVKRSDDDGISTLEISDNGVGLSEDDIINKLLSFGESGWLDDIAIGEYSEHYPTDDSISGKYGIGFFSIFMLADQIQVRSRRFDKTPDDTVVLTFSNGLDERPVIHPAEYSDRSTNGGTAIKISLKSSTLITNFSPIRSRFHRAINSLSKNESLSTLIAQLFPAVDVPIEVIDGEDIELIDGRNWESETAISLLTRIEGTDFDTSSDLFIDSIRPVVEEDGRVVGRAGIVPKGLRSSSREYGFPGAVVTRGTLACKGAFRGLMLGQSTRASRDEARLIASPGALTEWASHQASLLAVESVSDVDQIRVAEQVVAFGGDPGDLKICDVGGVPLNLKGLEILLRGRDEIWVVHDAAVSLASGRHDIDIRSDQSISVSWGWPAVIDSSSIADSLGWGSAQVGDLIMEVIAKAFELPRELIAEARRVENGKSVYRASAPMWITQNGEIIHSRGEYFRRGMTISDLEQFVVSG